MRRFWRRFTRSLERDFALRFLDDVLAGALPLPAERFIRDGGRECAAGRSRQVERCQQSVEFHALCHPPLRPGTEQLHHRPPGASSRIYFRAGKGSVEGAVRWSLTCWLLMARDRRRSNGFRVAHESLAFNRPLTQCALPHRMLPALELASRIARRPGRCIARPSNPQRCEQLSIQEIVIPTSTWIIVGLAVGFLASTSVIRSSHGLVMDLGLGLAGAVGAGLLFSALDASGATGLDALGLVVAVSGAGAALVAFHALFPSAPQG